MVIQPIISFLRQVGRSSFLWCGLFFLLVGCTAIPLDLSLSPTENMVIDSAPLQHTKSIGVSPFTDERPEMHGSDNAKWKGLLPGMLWIEISSDIPETYTPFSHYESKPLDRSTTKACINVLERSLLFAEVVDLQKRADAVTDYRLSGILYQTRVSETGYYYGSSIYAWLLRVLGLPYVSFKVEYHVGLMLTDVRTGDVLWQDDVKGSREDKFYTVYSVSNGRDGKHVIAWNIADILADEFNRKIPSIQQALSSFQ